MTPAKRSFTAHEKITILKEHLLENLPISKLSDKYGIPQSTLYGWRQELFRAGFNAFKKTERKGASQKTQGSDKEVPEPERRYDPLINGPVCIPEETFQRLAKIAIPYDAPAEIRKDAFVSFRDPGHRIIDLHFKLDPPYPFQIPEPELNQLGLPEKEYYTTGDLCRLLGLHPDTFRYRFKAGIYPEPNKRSGDKRRFTKEEVKEIVRITKGFPARKWRLR